MHFNYIHSIFEYFFKIYINFQVGHRGIVVRTSDSEAADPGSIPQGESFVHFLQNFEFPQTLRANFRFQ